MTVKKSISGATHVSGQSDDISALSSAFSFNAIGYVDIARNERLENILTRWPLLHELAAGAQENEN